MGLARDCGLIESGGDAKCSFGSGWSFEWVLMKMADDNREQASL